MGLSWKKTSEKLDFGDAHEWDMEVSKIKLDKEIFAVCSDYVLELRESNS